MLLLLAGVRAIYTLTEQPQSSLMPRYDYIQYVKTCLSTLLGCEWLDVPLSGPQIEKLYIHSFLVHMSSKMSFPHRLVTNIESKH